MGVAAFLNETLGGGVEATPTGSSPDAETAGEAGALDKESISISVGLGFEPWGGSKVSDIVTNMMKDYFILIFFTEFFAFSPKLMDFFFQWELNLH